jgi:hypothetical protein
MKRFAFVVICLAFFSACGEGKKVVVKNNDTRIVTKYAQILQIPKSDIKNIKLYKFIDDWRGTKYRFGGMSKSGVDCSGFCNVLYAQVYSKKILRTTSELSKKINKKSRGNLKEGDFVFFNISRKKNSHVGIYLKNNRFVHASSSKGVVISSLENPYYEKTYSKGGGLR